MKTKKAQKITLLVAIILCASLLVLASTTTLPYMGYGTPVKAQHVVQCLLGLIWTITPYIMLAMLAIAGLKWLASGESRRDRLQAKHYIEWAFIGFACVGGLMAAATILGMPPLTDCMTGGTIITQWPPMGWSGLQCPNGVQTTNYQCGPP